MDNLTRDSLAAQELGMSYGKYKALNPVKPAPAPREGLRRCRFCGKEFLPRWNRQYCGDECRRNADRKRNRERMERTRRLEHDYTGGE